jgi:hypothetical protein
MSGTIPFPELRQDTAVIFAVIEGKRPLQPMSCTGTTVLDSLWELLNDCWEGRAKMRPTAPQIVERLKGPSIGAKTGIIDLLLDSAVHCRPLIYFYHLLGLNTSFLARVSSIENHFTSSDPLMQRQLKVGILQHNPVENQLIHWALIQHIF